MRRRTGQVFVMLYLAREGSVRQTQAYGWVDTTRLAQLARDLDRIDEWSGFVPFGRGIEQPADRARFERYLQSGRAMTDYAAAEPGEPYVFPRISCEKHGNTRMRFLVCTGCGHVEDIDADPDGPLVLECPGGCGAPFTPLADPSQFTARPLCLTCGLDRATQPACAHEAP